MGGENLDRSWVENWPVERTASNARHTREEVLFWRIFLKRILA
jgi:hypothetical protein